MEKLDQDQPVQDAPMDDQADQNELAVAPPHNDHAHLTAIAAPWLTWIMNHAGQKETHKTGHSNPFILDLFNKHTSYKTNTDNVPYCAATVSAALELTGFRSMHSAWAFAYKTYGTKCEIKPGAILVFGFGHVAVCSSVSGDHVAAWGGNQGPEHMVKLSVFHKSSVVASRWPVK